MIPGERGLCQTHELHFAAFDGAGPLSGAKNTTYNP
jgi:hypothetical protein